MVHIRIEDLESYAFNNNIPIMQKDGIEFLCKYIKENNIKNILEIGSAIGYSAIKMALVDSDVKVTTIERDKERYDIAVNNIKKFNLQDRINIINEDALILNIGINDKYDLIFIDAAKSQYIKFFEKFEKNLKDGGVIVSDNLSFHGLVEDESKTNNRNTKQLVRKIRKYIDYLKDNPNYKTTFYELGDGVAISIKIK
ncbi:MAG: O-methyltransferase [Firmicutes bacterium]|nr:O-methyltransferase [Bacillota bacterium]